ncbi:polyunsaturated fatty acid 5-lipoxygenase-like isoform X1 [Oratosquilla oratoria]|uniref:polyunsaturated fatty acid 5-lipoxygenase-like isoform X1 n=1 Tax=Oratosquilla oratoria TaxID=337810 RepID=UPI003F761CE7
MLKTRDWVREMLMESVRGWSGRGLPEHYRVHVVTGDRRGAGTDANVYLVLHDTKDLPSLTLRPNRIFTNDHERNSVTTLPVRGDAGVRGPISRIRIWRDNFGDFSFVSKIMGKILGQEEKTGQAAWYLDRIEVEEYLDVEDTTVFYTEEERPAADPPTSRRSSVDELANVPKSRKWVFPVQRWIAPNKHYDIYLHDLHLPQDDPRQEFRREELEAKRQEYKYEQKTEGGPCQVETLPADERFSESYYWDFTKRKSKLLTTTIFTEWTQTSWNSLDDLKSVYSKSLGEPYPMRRWKEDRWFGLQRVQGVNPVIIQLCTSLPENLDVTDATLEGLLDDLTLEEALEKKKMFICNLDILDGLDCKDDKELAAPIALFYLDKDDKLNPVAIQLRQQKGEDNPVYTPNDSPNTWLVAKMFYNNAEAQHHQALTHLGFTHLLMEGVVVCTHRNLSPSHPLFKLLAPHFLFLLAINERGLRKLVSPGGWVDRSMTQGVKGIFNLIKRGLEQWRFDIHGKPETFLRHNGTLDPEVLPYYPYRDDALLLHNEIEKYVTQVVQHHYDTPEKLAEDWELQWWREELVKQRQLGGVGLEGVPGDPVKGFCKVEEVIETVTVIISTCSLGHSAANFQQYEQYAFVPNYPGILMEDPPKTKREYDEKDIMKLLPNKRTTLDIMVITNLLSSKGTKSLGDFEMQYLYDPVGVRAAEEFRKNLKKASCIVNIRNLDRELEFDWLNPAIVPNSISV